MTCIFSSKDDAYMLKSSLNLETLVPSER